MNTPEPSFAVCRLAVVPVRRFADMVSEMTTQVRFGEGVEVLSENRRMWNVRLCQDGYEGWVDSRQFTPLLPKKPAVADTLTSELAGWATHAEERRLLPPGTPLPDFKEGKFWLGSEAWEWSGAVHRVPAVPDWDALLFEADRYSHAPYFWGGRTVWGIDCSGLVQTLLRHQGVSVRRDCIDLVDDGEAVPGLAHAKPGDLAFFDGTRDGGRHVGFVMGGGKVLHASGYVRVDRLTDRGIVVPESGHLSHRLTALRRVASWGGFGS
ncbi:MAG: Hydrolase [Verrucomicrobiales bacterium]|nr:Hydrolase [Verrucomicrobiales bacterium]